MITKSDLETNLQRVHEWIRAADQKVSIFLAFQGVVITLLFPNAFLWIRGNLKEFFCFNVVLPVAGVVLVGYSIYKSTSAIIPRLKNHKSKKSLTYFGDIARLELEDFKKKLRGVSNEDYESELVDQIHISSKIAARKHSQFKDAIVAFFVGILLLALSFLIFKV